MIVDATRVVSWNLSWALADVARSYLALLTPGKLRINIRFAALATERPWFVESCERHFTRAFIVIKLGWLGQGLDHETELYPSLRLHQLVLGSMHRSGSEESRGCPPFIN